MIMTIGMFLAVVMLLLIGYVGELISSATQRDTERESERGFDADPALEGGISR